MEGDEKAQQAVEGDSRSSVVERVPESIRRMVDESILESPSGGYKKWYRHWGLEGYGVSFTAFYMYARGLRQRAAAAHLREMTGEPQADFTERLPGLVAQRIAEQLAYADSDRPIDLQRLLGCYRIALDAVRRKRLAEAEAEKAAIEERKRRTPVARYGRKEDGTPYTHAEFLKTLHEAVADIYGVDLDTGQEVFHPTPEQPTPPPGFKGIVRAEDAGGAGRVE